MALLTSTLSPQDNTFDHKIDALLEQMTLAEKIGQMAQVDKDSLSLAAVTTYAVGSILSGGGGNPTPNSPSDWATMVRNYAQAALVTRLKIPIIYGADCVHGHSNCYGAVMFPHNIGLGAARDADLVKRIGAITAREMLATNVHWTFAPCLAVAQDPRWGRTYESFGSDPVLVSQLGAAYVHGLQAGGAAASIKHFVGDGAAEWNTRRPVSWATFWEDTGGLWAIDQGDVNLDESTFRQIHLAPYVAAVQAGALTVMASFNSWRGLKMHAHRYMLTDVLKGELGFQGFVVSDWMAINQLSPDYYTCVIQSINAGLDMVMVPYDFRRFIQTLTEAVEKGDVPLSRIDDAVRRILYVKHKLNLFEQPLTDLKALDSIGSAEHRAVAREAVRKSLVLLKNENRTLPLPETTSHLLVAGQGADDIGLQCGGWTIEWQGKAGDITPGTTLQQALKRALPENTQIDYAEDGNFSSNVPTAKVGIVVISEQPYAEGCGDCADLSLSASELELIHRMRARCQKLILLIYAGRQRIITDIVPLCDAIVMAWLPGTEGDGLADVLCGKYPFTGRLPFDWLVSMEQLSLPSHQREIIYPYDFGLV